MTVDELRKELGDLMLDIDGAILCNMRECVERLAIKKYGKIPYVLRLGMVGGREGIRGEEDDDFTASGELISRPLTDDNIDFDKTLENITKEYKDAAVFKIVNCGFDECVVYHDDFIMYEGNVYCESNKVPERLLKCVAEMERKPRLRWVLRNSRGGIDTMNMTVSPKGNIKENYNDDFEAIDKKVNSLIRGKNSSIIILHGKPGTGKTSYIRNLIGQNTDIKFYWLDSSMFNYIDSTEFISFIADCKNGVFILEDSEMILTSRDVHRNPAMQSLLSISDGMLGDNLNLKFICTFNTDLTNIDKAIMRKGRMKIKYEFKNLKKEKVEKIFETLGIDKSLAKDMPLSDVYNFLDDNGGEVKRHGIGFN